MKKLLAVVLILALLLPVTGALHWASFCSLG